jgi:phosphate transport system protein
MRDTYHEALDAVSDQLVDMGQKVGTMMERASRALLECDLAMAESVIAADDDVDDLNRELEEKATALLALQQPVATDLRIILGGLRMSTTLERMGDLARHIAKVARMRYPDSAVPEMFRPIFADMATQAVQMASDVTDVIAAKDITQALEVEKLDDRMDELHRLLLETLLSDQWAGTVDQAVDITLMGRYYERFADHAVSLARRTVYLATGSRYDELEKA